MIFRRYYKNSYRYNLSDSTEMERGMIIVDILLALSLSVIFISILTEASIDSRQLYENALLRNSLLDAYESGNSQAISSTTRLFGNDRLETITAAAYVLASSTVRSANAQISFIAVTSDNSHPIGMTTSGGLCSADFTNKQIIGSYEYLSHLHSAFTLNIKPILLPIDPLLPLSDIEVRNGLAYISTDSTVAIDPDILVMDISDTNNAQLLSSLNTGPGLADIILSGKRIFSAATSRAAQLHVIEMNSPSSLFLEKKYKLPLPYATATSPLASSIFYDKDKIYLGTEKWDGPEFNIIDVANVLQPAYVGGLEIGNKISDIILRDQIAYIATSNEKQLQLVDVANPSLPLLANFISPSGSRRQEGQTLSYFEDNLNFGRTSGGYNVKLDHEAFSFASTSSTTLAQYFSADIPGGVYGIVQDRSHIFLATRNIDKEFQIFDRNLSTTSVEVYSLPVAPQAMTCDNDKIYILAHTAPVIYEISFNEK